MKRMFDANFIKKVPRPRQQLVVHPVPDGLYDFYNMCSPFIDTFTGKTVTKLTPYQEEMWADQYHSNYRLILKSQKLGATAELLLEDAKIALTRARGKQILLVAQNESMARMHMQNFKKILIGSKWDALVIDKPTMEDGILKDERTKVNVTYLRNPGNPRYPTKIIALGFTNLAQLISWTAVEHIHCSDITATTISDERFEEHYAGLRTRLALTRGSMVIEGPPRGARGAIYDIVASDPGLLKDGVRVEIPAGGRHITPDGWLVRKYPYQVGIDAGLFTEEFIEQERLALGKRFSMFYEADFYSEDQSFYSMEHISNESDEAADWYDDGGI